MLGDVVRDTRIRKGLTQAKLARLAGVSRRHLAALEKGANVSVLVLKKVASVLDLTEIQLGDLSLRAGDGAKSSVNIAVLSDTIREARDGALRAEALLAKAEGILQGGSGKGSANLRNASAHFPRMPARTIEPPQAGAGTVNDRSGDWTEVRTAGVLRQGQPIDESEQETVLLPSSLLEKDEIVFRVRGDELADLNIHDGDLLVVQLRQKGRAATGELAIGRIGENVYVGRWWQKHGRKALMSDGLAEVTVGRSKGSLKVVAVINAILRER